MFDEEHERTRPKTVDLFFCAIRAYFDRNDSQINFKLNSKVRYDESMEDEDKSEVTLEDLLKLLTTGRPTIMEKAVVICKLQSGLDNSTFVDRFDFQVWKQLADWFGTEEYARWDEQRCPVPIKLIRIKNQFQHTEFLDVDAIHAIQEWMKIVFFKILHRINFSIVRWYNHKTRHFMIM